MAVTWSGVCPARSKDWCFSSSATMGSSLQFPQELHSCRCNYGHRSSVVSALRTSSGFGKRPETKAKPKILKELDVGKVEKTVTYKIFARKVAGEEALSKWESIGEIVIESGASIEIALKERKNLLVAGVKHQHPILVILEKGESVQYGFQLKDSKQEEAQDGEKVITTVDVSGKQPEETVPAILRVEDGKLPGKRKF